MRKSKELKGISLLITDQYPQEIMNRWRLLYPIMTEARNGNKGTRLVVDKLFIDGQLFRNSDITYWLTGGNEKAKQRELDMAFACNVLPTGVNNGAGL